MTRLPAVRGCQGIGILLLLAGWTALPAQQQAPPADGDAPPEGVEVLARGPVHEAFAEPAQAKSSASPTIAKEPPEAVEEEPPDQKPDGEGVQWLPGYWAWDEERDNFLWISGFWRTPPPGRTWMPGRWNKVETGYQWVPGFWYAVAAPAQPNAPAQEQQLTYLPPPPEPMEAGPSVPQPDTDHYYVPGYWVYRDTRYVWRPGFWARCRPDWVWVPAHYVWTPCGYVFVDGYWDYTLRDRGLLFAPVSFDVAVVRRPGWRYCPTYVIQHDCLTAALFVRPGYSTYYFGDYFEVGHRRAGYVAFTEVRVGTYRCDPLYSHYHVAYRSNPGWEISLRAGYVGRYNGEIARPPRTLVQQTTVVNNITVNNVTNNTTVINNNKTVNNINNVNNTNNVAMVSSIKQAKGVAMKPVAPEERQSQAVAAKQVVQAAQQRGTVEKQVLAQGPPPTKATDAPRTVKMDLPKPAPAARIESASQAKPGAGPAKLDASGPKVEAKNPGIAPKLEPKSAVTAPKVDPKAGTTAPKVDAARTPAAPPPGSKVEAKNPAPVPPPGKVEAKNVAPVPLPGKAELKAPPTISPAVTKPDLPPAKTGTAPVPPPPPANKPNVAPPGAGVKQASVPPPAAPPPGPAPQMKAPVKAPSPPARPARDPKDKDKEKEKKDRR